MNFADLPLEEKKTLAEIMFKPLNSAQELKDWILLFLGLDMPMGHIDPDSTSSPIEAMFEIYETVRFNRGDVQGGYILLSARAAYKTLSVSILETILILHFKYTLAHMAAIREQSAMAVSYINLFFTKITPLLEVAGWQNKSSNKNEIEYRTDDGQAAYIKVVVCTPAGANSKHTNMLCVAEGSKITVANDGLVNNERHKIQIFASTLFDHIESGKEVKALTFNHSNGSLEFKKILKAYRSKKSILNIRTENGNLLRVSGDHPVYVLGKGYISASKLQINDPVLRLGRSSTYSVGKEHEKQENFDPLLTPESDYVEQILIGSLLGDGGCYKKPSNNAYFAEQHSQKQGDYLRWKADILRKEYKVRENVGYSGYRNAHDMVRISTGNSEKLNKYANFKETLEGIEKLNTLGLAVWFMDDGSGNQSSFSINSQCFTKEQNELLANLLNTRFGLEVKAAEYKKNGKIYWYLRGTARSLYKMYKICEPYWHPSMLYKFKTILEVHENNCKFCNVKYIRSETQSRNSVTCTNAACVAIHKKRVNLDKIVDIQQGRVWACIDFTVEDNHNFFSDSILVHNCVDEIDVIANPLAYQESKRIPTYANGKHPITIKLSTRKYAFGMMSKEIENAPISGDKILRWNIMDITEKCPPSRHRPELPTESRYVNKTLPLRQISVEEYDSLVESEKVSWELVKDAFDGCKSCPLLPVCKTRLATMRTDKDVDGLYRPISAVINEFKTTEPGMAEAQLMCWRPSTKGLVYPRFEGTIDIGNVISLSKAFETLTGTISRKKEVQFNDIVSVLKTLDVRIVAGVDWGYTHNTVLVFFALIPNGEVWIIDCFSQQGLEFSDILSIAKDYRDKYKPEKWFCDTSMPANMKSFTRNGMRAPRFTKDIMGGIESIRSKIVDGNGRRLLKVLNTDNNKKVINAFQRHHFKLDSTGNPTLEPDDDIGTADEADAMRYVGQNMFPVKGTQKPGAVWVDSKGQTVPADSPEAREQAQKASVHENQMLEEINNRLSLEEASEPVKKKGSFFWSI